MHAGLFLKKKQISCYIFCGSVAMRQNFDSAFTGNPSSPGLNFLSLYQLVVEPEANHKL